MTYELTRVHTGLDFGEGPRWHDNKLWFSDFFRYGVFTLDADGTETKIVEVNGQPSGLGWLPNGELLVVSMTDQKVLRFDGTDTHVHADLAPFVVGNCNDMVVAVDGTAYVGNFGFDLDSGAPRATTTLVKVEPDGVASIAADDLNFPNGMVIAANGATLIVGETMGNRFTAFSIDTDGTLFDRRMWADLNGGVPDGCCLDDQGAIWYADPKNSVVRRVLAGGIVTDTIEVAQTAIACALGGPDLRTLYVLSSAGTHPRDVAGTGTGVIESVEVEFAGAGRP